MEFTTFVRKPFVVEAVEVTEDNIAEIAGHLGTLETKEDGTPYIQVERRPFLNIKEVTPGYWMTMMGNNIRCYSKLVFEKQFIQSTPDIEVLCKTLINDSNDKEDVE